MAEFKVLHLYHDLMNLYGDWANADILVRALKARGHKASVKKLSIGDKVSFAEYDAVYIGSGTERSQRACMKDLMRFKRSLLGRIEKGMLVLATGNSHELFGCTVEAASGERYNGLGLLGFETVQRNSRVTGDCVYTATFPSADENGETTSQSFDLIGFINRAGGGQFDIDKDSDEPSEKPPYRPFSVKLGPGASEGMQKEGIMYKNLIGTYMTGPVLVRNPPLLAYVADVLTASVDGGGAPNSKDELLFERQETAYRTALSELKQRQNVV